jgi:ubiquinone/menaquinone biosynthesis C-methylase UbiE
VLKRIFASLEERRGRRIARLLRDYLEPGERVLDLGCGSLIAAQQIETWARVHVVGLDRLAFPQRPLPLVLYGGGTVPFRDRSFDTVVLAFVLHHCEDGGRAVLGEARRVARRQILVLEDAYEHVLERWLTRAVDRLLNRIENPSIPVPLRFRPAHEWQRQFTDLGLRVETVRTVRTTPILETRQRLFVLCPCGAAARVGGSAG